jgi:hypothetical protein
LCGSKQTKSDYLFTEYVPGKTLTKYLRDYNFDCTATVFNVMHPIICQIIYSLIVANKYDNFEYTHYDLHSGNVIIQELPNNMTTTYTIFGIEHNVSTNVIPRLIDYGRSRITVNEISHGYMLIELGINAFVSNVLWDIYRILHCSINCLLKRQIPVPVFMANIYSLFIEQNNEFTFPVDNSVSETVLEQGFLVLSREEMNNLKNVSDEMLVNILLLLN